MNVVPVPLHPVAGGPAVGALTVTPIAPEATSLSPGAAGRTWRPEARQRGGAGAGSGGEQDEGENAGTARHPP